MYMPANTQKARATLVGFPNVFSDSVPVALTSISISSSDRIPTKSAWVTLGTAADTYEGFLLCVRDNTNNTTVKNFLIDLFITGSDVSYVGGGVIVRDLKVEKYGAAFTTNSQIYVPCRVPKGQVIRARVGRAEATEYTMQIGVIGFTSLLGGQSGYARTFYLGTLASQDSKSTQCEGDSGAFGAWSQVTASTPVNISAISFSAFRDAYSYDSTNHLIRAQVGVGSAGNEFVIADHCFGATNLSTHVQSFMDWVGPFSFSIPAGSRVAIRAKENRGLQQCGVHVMGWSNESIS